MSESIEKPSRSDEPIEYEFRWTQQRWDARNKYFGHPKAIPADISFDEIGYVIAIISMILIGVVYFLEFYGHLGENFTPAFGLGGLIAFLMAVAGAWVHARRKRGKQQDPTLDSLLIWPTETVTVNRGGVTSAGPSTNTHFKWTAFTQIDECSVGIVLVVAPGMALFVPDDALPEDIGRAEALSRVKRWKGPW